MISVIDLINICNYPNESGISILYLEKNNICFSHLSISYDENYALFTTYNYCLLLDIYNNSRNAYTQIYSPSNQLYSQFLENTIEEGKNEKGIFLKYHIESFIVYFKTNLSNTDVIISGWNKTGDELIIQEVYY